MPKRQASKSAADKVVDSRGHIGVVLEGQRFELRPSEMAIDAIEKQLGRSLFELTGEATRGALSMHDMAVIVSEMMRAYGRAAEDDPLITTYRGAKPESIRPLIMEAGAPNIVAPLAVVLMGALTGGYTAAGEPKATGTT